MMLKTHYTPSLKSRCNSAQETASNLDSNEGRAVGAEDFFLNMIFLDWCGREGGGEDLGAHPWEQRRRKGAGGNFLGMPMDGAI